MLCPEEFFLLSCTKELKTNPSAQDPEDKDIQECMETKTKEFIGKGISEDRCWVRYNVDYKFLPSKRNKKAKKEFSFRRMENNDFAYA